MNLNSTFFFFVVSSSGNIRNLLRANLKSLACTYATGEPDFQPEGSSDKQYQGTPPARELLTGHPEYIWKLNILKSNLFKGILSWLVPSSSV